MAQSIAKVLLVDDYDANVMIAGNYLDYFGYAYDVAKSGFEAIDKVQSNDYIAVLMDVQMPQMDGIEACARIRRLEQNFGLARTPIIALTAHALSGNKEACLAAGMDDYITKPFNPQELKDALEQFTDS